MESMEPNLTSVGPGQVGLLSEVHMDEKEDRAQRKKGVVVPKSGGVRRSSVGGVVAEAAKKFLASTKGGGSGGVERPPLPRRPTLKGR